MNPRNHWLNNLSLFTDKITTIHETFSNSFETPVPPGAPGLLRIFIMKKFIKLLLNLSKNVVGQLANISCERMFRHSSTSESKIVKLVLVGGLCYRGFQECDCHPTN